MELKVGIEPTGFAYKANRLPLTDSSIMVEKMSNDLMRLSLQVTGPAHLASPFVASFTFIYRMKRVDVRCDTS